MSNRTVYYVTGERGRWAVTKEGGQRASAVCPTKTEAEQTARSLAKAQPLGQVKVQDQNGRFQKEWTYGNDPERYPG